MASIGSTGINTGPACNETYVLRIMKDIKEFYRENSQDIHIVAEEEDMTTVHALIRGPEKTPYQNGFFYFLVKFGSDYPLKPPKVKLLTTGNRTVRFNPNLYSDGKVCLSILGTWQGPAWTAAQTLFTTLLSVQSLMNEKPYHNEPGYEEQSPLGRRLVGTDIPKDVKNYNDMIEHETIRVAVIGMLGDSSVDSRNMPKVLKDIMISFFKTNYKYYEEFVRSKQGLDGQPISDPFHDPYRLKKFEYKKLLKELLALKQKYCQNNGTGGQSSQSVSTDGSTASAQLPRDPLVEPYYEIAAKMMVNSNDTQPKDPKTDHLDNWDDLIDDMNDELNEDQLLEDYSEDESDSEDQNQPNQQSLQS